MELDEPRKIAEQATQGNWMWVNDRTPEHIRAGRFPYTPVAYTDDVSDGDSLFIATFDPPTVLALITRLEQAEQDRVKLRNRLDAMRRQRDGYRNQLRKTEQQVARVRKFLEYCKANSAVARVGLRALDGDTRRLADQGLGDNLARTTKNGDA